MESYWIVVCLRLGPSGSPKRHQSLNSAITEAKRLAEQSPGDEFDVLQAVKRAKHVVVQVEDFDDPDKDIPF